MDKITEIRIEETFDLKNEEVKIIGKSSVKPQCYKQTVRYLK